MRQAIGIPMGIDPAPFWANLFLYTYENDYIENLITSDKVKARHFHSTKRFIDDLCAINDGDVFGENHKNIYPGELELKVEHHGQHASFLSLDITIVDKIFVYKLSIKEMHFHFLLLECHIVKVIFLVAYSTLHLLVNTCASLDLLCNFKTFFQRLKSSSNV